MDDMIEKKEIDVRVMVELANKYQLPQRDTDFIIEYLSYNENGIAFEALCGAIEAEKIMIATCDYNLIVSLGKQMKMDENLWVALSSNGFD